jgi:cytochrome c-type biogenesis protein CcmH
MIGLFFLLALLALVCVLAPAFWSKRRWENTGLGDGAEFSRVWYQERMDALEAEELDPAQRTELADELAAVLLAEYPDQVPQPETETSTPRPSLFNPGNILLVLGTVLVVLAVGLYTQLGSYGAIKIQGAQQILALAPEESGDVLRDWQSRLGEWLAGEPEDAQSWYLLGHAHLKLGEFSRASSAFQQAHEFADGDVSVKFYWLQARYLETQGVLDDRSRRLAEDILAVDPNNPQVLEMLAVAAISEGDSAMAITMLNRTLNSEQRPERIQATVDAIGALRSAYAQQGDAAGIEIDVAMPSAEDKALTGVVFVVARPVGGGMPYAVVRRPSWLLPFSVTLDDLVSMSGTRLLSQADDFEVLVRLSANGLAQGEAGDWQWLSQPMTSADLEQPKRLQARLSPPT